MASTLSRGSRRQACQSYGNFEKQGDLGALNTWYIEYVDKHPRLLREAMAIPAAELSQLKIMQNVVQQHEQILALYRHLESRLPPSHAQQWTHRPIFVHSQRVWSARFISPVLPMMKGMPSISTLKDNKYFMIILNDVALKPS
jgi:hypothetical protein